MNGSAARMKGVWRNVEVAAFGFSAAFFMAAEVSVMTDSEVCFAESRAREAGILKVAVAVVDMVVRHVHTNAGEYGR